MARVEGNLDQARNDIEAYSPLFKLMQRTLKRFGAMKPFQGPIPITDENSRGS